MNFLIVTPLQKIKNTISKDTTVTDGIFEKYKDNFEKRYLKTILNIMNDDLITLFNEFGEVGEIQTEDLDLFISLLSVSVKDEGKVKEDWKWQYILGDKYENNQENLKSFDNIIDDLKRLKILKI